MFIPIDQFSNDDENSLVRQSPLLDELDAVDHIVFSQTSENEEVAIDRFAGYSVVDLNPQPMLVIIENF